MTEHEIRVRLQELHKEQMELLRQLDKFRKPATASKRSGTSSFMRMCDTMINSKRSE